VTSTVLPLWVLLVVGALAALIAMAQADNLGEGIVLSVIHRPLLDAAKARRA